jgi:hypothetical protein
MGRKSRSLNAPFRDQRGLSIEDAWFKWALMLSKDLENGLVMENFNESFLYGIGSQNVRALRDQGLYPGFPNPEPTDMTPLENNIDTVALIYLMDRVNVPPIARKVIIKKLFELGLVKNILPDHRYYYKVEY